MDLPRYVTSAFLHQDLLAEKETCEQYGNIPTAASGDYSKMFLSIHKDWALSIKEDKGTMEELAIQRE